MTTRLPIDHPGLPEEYERAAHHLPRSFNPPSLFQVANTLLLFAIGWLLVNFLLTMIELRGIRDQIYTMTEQAINTQQEACFVDTVQGIKVEHCVRTVAR